MQFFKSEEQNCKNNNRIRAKNGGLETEKNKNYHLPFKIFFLVRISFISNIRSWW